MKDILGNNRVEVHSIHSSSVDKHCSAYLIRKKTNNSHHNDLIQDKKRTRETSKEHHNRKDGVG